MEYENHGDITALFTVDLKMKDRPWVGSHVAPLTVQFTDKSLGNPTAWHWDFGDDTFSREQNPTKIFLNDNITVKMWAWKNASSIQNPYSGNSGNRRDNWDTVPDWVGQWAFTAGLEGSSTGMTIYRRASVEPFSDSKRVELAYTTVWEDLSTRGDAFLTLLQTSDTFNAFYHYDSIGGAPAIGMTVSCFDSGLSRQNNNPIYHRDYNLTVMDTMGSDLGDVGNFGNTDDYSITSFTWMDWFDDPYKNFEEMGPFEAQNWPLSAGDRVGYWGNVFTTVEVTTFEGDDWGWMSMNFDDYPFDFVGSPRVGIAMLTVYYTDLSTVVIDEWDWDFGDGTVSGVTAGSTHQHPVHMYTYE